MHFEARRREPAGFFVIWSGREEAELVVSRAPIDKRPAFFRTYAGLGHQADDDRHLEERELREPALPEHAEEEEREDEDEARPECDLDEEERRLVADEDAATEESEDAVAESEQ